MLCVKKCKKGRRKERTYRVNVVDKRQSSIPGVLELAGNIGGP